MSTYVKVDEIFDKIVFAGNSQRGTMEFTRCTGNELLFDGNTQRMTLQLVGCSIKILCIRSSEIRSVVIHNCEIERIEITNELASSVRQTIETLTIHGTKIGVFSGVAAVLRESLINHSTIKEIEFDQSQVTTIHFDDVSINDQFRLMRSVSYRLYFSSCTIGGLFFNQGEIQTMTIEKATIAGEVELTMDSYHDLSFKDCNIETLVLSGGSCQAAQIIAGQVNYLEIGIGHIKDLYVGPKSNWDTHKMSIRKLNLEQHLIEKDCQVKLHNLNVQELLMNSLENHGRLDVSDVMVGYCNIGNGRLNRSIFNNVQFEQLELFGAVLSDSTFSNIIWPKDYQLKEFDQEVADLLEEKAIVSLTSQRKITMYSKVADAYCQLKAVSLKQNNKFAALQFQMHEMRFQYRIIVLKTFCAGFGSFLAHVKDWLLLGTNRFFSDFGVSWWKPLRALTFTIVLYLWWITNTYDLGVRFIFDPREWTSHSWDALQDGLRLYVKLLSPVRDGKVGSLTISNFTGLTVVDFLIRIFSSYLIYNFIRGTRKFNFGV